MTCLHARSTVLETRDKEDGYRHRRRLCFVCHSTYKTVEIPLETAVTWSEAFDHVAARADLFCGVDIDAIHRRAVKG